MRVRYLGPSEWERTRERERVAARLIRAHVEVNYPSATVLELRVDVLRGDIGATVYAGRVQLRDIVVDVSGVLDSDFRAARMVVR